ncbi:hypothetical protein I4U23_009833 [Adineta vaga]|nr:hypothetical protein I4U23_009833 [Adineta vaga]
MSQPCYNMTWVSGFRPIGRAYLALAIPAFIFHILFWIQVATHRPLRQLSMLWVYNYLFTDMLLLLQLFIEYSLRTSLPYCISPRIFKLFCGLEAYTSAYITVLEAYILVCLNITRYYLIVKNCDIATRYPYILILINLFLYLFGALFLFFQTKFVQIVTVHVHQHSSSCHLQYHNVKTQIGNLIAILLIPIVLNCYFVALTTIHVRHSQRAARAQHSKHLQLLIQFFVLYTLWLSFWAPNAILSHIISNNYPSIYSRFGSILSALVGPLIFMLIDRRFFKVWKHTLYRLARFGRPSRQIYPSTIANEHRLPTFF